MSNLPRPTAVRRTAVLLATAALAATVGAAPAQAATESATGFARCPGGHFCVFTEPYGGGRMAAFRFGAPNLAAFGVDNSAKSLHNLSGRAFCAYAEPDYRGLMFPPVKQAGADGRGLNLAEAHHNRMSSVRAC